MPIAQAAVFREILAGVLIASCGLLLRFALDPLLGSLQPFAPGFVALAATVWYFGWRGGVAAAAVMYFGATYLFVEPRYEWTFHRPSDVAMFFTNTTSSGLLIWFGERARRYAAAARRSIEQKDQFVAMVAHEIRGPMGAAANAVRVAQEGGVAEPVREGALLIATRQLKLMERLIQDLLDWSRIRRHQLTIQATQIDLRECIDEAVAMIRPSAASRGQGIAVHAPAALPITADRGRILQMLFNLLDNACRHAPAGASIEVRVRTGDMLDVEVADSGSGIPADLLPEVFEFERDREHVSRSSGLGLGLPITRILTELHGGRILAGRCPVLGGACITIRLPRSVG